MNKILCFATVLLMACGSTPAHQTTGDASSVEEAAVSHLYYVLNSDTGHVMTASELAHQKSGNGIFMIDLPIDESKTCMSRLSDGYTRLAEASTRYYNKLSCTCSR